MPVRIERRDMPLTLHYLEADISAEHTQCYMNELEQILTSTQKMASITFSERVGRIDAQGIKMLAQWLQRNATLISRQWIGAALVITSPTVRFALSSIMMLVRLPMPLKTFDSYEAATRWLASRFREENLSLPATLMAYT